MLNLGEVFGLFGAGVGVGALLSAFPWLIGLAIHTIISVIRRGS